MQIHVIHHFPEEDTTSENLRPEPYQDVVLPKVTTGHVTKTTKVAWQKSPKFRTH